MTLLPFALAQVGPLSVAQRYDADVIVWLPDGSAGDGALRGAFRRRSVVAVGRGGESVRLYDHGLHLAAELRGDLTPDTVLDAIRARAGGAR